LQYRERACAGLDERIGNEKPARGFVRIVRLRQSRVRKMDSGEAIVAVAPAFCRALDVAKHRRRDRSAIRCGEQRQQTHFFALYICRTAVSHRWQQDRSGTQDETVWRKMERRTDRNGTLSHGPRIAQMLVQHASPFRLGSGDTKQV
jgi:hypothetical protein